jgi:hypothetical protein
MFGIALMSGGYEVEEYETSSVSELEPFPAGSLFFSMTISCPGLVCANTMAVGPGQLRVMPCLLLTPGTSSTSTGFRLDRNHADGRLVFVKTLPGLAFEFAFVAFSPPTPRHATKHVRVMFAENPLPSA